MGEEQTTTIKFLSIDEVETAPDLEPIWGNWFFRDAVILEVGEPGISKTTFNFGLSKALVDNKPFLGVKAAIQNPIILYLEFEASQSLVKSRMKAMGGYPKNKDHFKLYLREDEFHTISQIDKAIGTSGINPDIVFVDPIRLAFVMQNENDNAEGTRHIKVIKGIARKYRCCVVLVHHSSKAEMTGTRKGSGAYVWSALSDVNMNFDRLYDKEGAEIDRDLFAFSIPKNRMIDDDFCVCIKKVHDGRSFSVVNFPQGVRIGADGYGTALERYSIQQLIMEEIIGVNELEYKDIAAAVRRVGGKENATDTAIHKAITNCLNIGTLTYQEKGKKRLYRREGV